jgi:hypothetical protein
MKRRTAGVGASLPAPVSREGWFTIAQASRRCPAGRTVARLSAAMTSLGSRPGEITVTACANSTIGSPWSSGHRSQRGCP